MRKERKPVYEGAALSNERPPQREIYVPPLVTVTMLGDVVRGAGTQAPDSVISPTGDQPLL